MTISSAVKSLISYAQREGLIDALDKRWATNRILEVLGLDSIDDDAVFEDASLEDILKAMLDYACEAGMCEDSVVYRDLLDTKIMGAIIPRPSEVISKFNALYAESPEKATDYYYDLSKKSDYIREYRIKNDIKWITSTEYGDIDITINLSKPEKNNKDIAKLLKSQNVFYIEVLPYNNLAGAKYKGLLREYSLNIDKTKSADVEKIFGEYGIEVKKI